MAMTDKKQAAKDLYMTDKYNQAEIARMLGITEGTLSKWATKEDWDTQRVEAVSLHSDIETDIKFLIRRNCKILRARAERDDQLLADGEVDGWANLELTTGKDTDALSKLFSQIKRDELKTKDRIEVISDFLKFVESKDLSMAKALIPFTDNYRDILFNKK